MAHVDPIATLANVAIEAFKPITELRDMKRDCIEFGSHTVNHVGQT
jgi:hypothetical protein